MQSKCRLFSLCEPVVVDLSVSYDDESANAISSHRRPGASRRSTSNGAQIVVAQDAVMEDADSVECLIDKSP